MSAQPGQWPTAEQTPWLPAVQGPHQQPYLPQPHGTVEPSPLLLTQQQTFGEEALAVLLETPQPPGGAAIDDVLGAGGLFTGGEAGAVQIATRHAAHASSSALPGPGPGGVSNNRRIQAPSPEERSAMLEKRDSGPQK